MRRLTGFEEPLRVLAVSRWADRGSFCAGFTVLRPVFKAVYVRAVRAYRTLFLDELVDNGVVLRGMRKCDG
jgi:hypothetical protein